jgi:hypothetical protein
MKVGDIVVDSKSKSTNLKRKTYRVIYVDSTNIITVITPTGTQKSVLYYGFINIDRYPSHLLRKIDLAERSKRSAEIRLLNKRQDLRRFQADSVSIDKWFPKI